MEKLLRFLRRCIYGSEWRRSVDVHGGGWLASFNCILQRTQQLVGARYQASIAVDPIELLN
eukprot:SAG31_NODE_1740_length_7394_cov_7.518849_11_plen_61_part_00